jgi:hypothetical protein
MRAQGLGGVDGVVLGVGLRGQQQGVMVEVGSSSSRGWRGWVLAALLLLLLRGFPGIRMSCSWSHQSLLVLFQSQYVMRTAQPVKSEAACLFAHACGHGDCLKDQSWVLAVSLGCWFKGAGWEPLCAACKRMLLLAAASFALSET